AVRIARDDMGERELAAHRHEQPGKRDRVAAALAPVHADHDVCEHPGSSQLGVSLSGDGPTSGWTCCHLTGAHAFAGRGRGLSGAHGGTVPGPGGASAWLVPCSARPTVVWRTRRRLTATAARTATATE